MFRKRAASRPQPADLIAALDDLQRLAASRPELAGPAETLTAALDATFRVPEPSPPAQDDERFRTIESALSAGNPAARSVDLVVDPGRLSDRAHQVAEALRGRHEAADHLLRALARDPSRAWSWGRAILAGRADEALRDWGSLGLAPDLAAAVVRLAWLPSLAAWAQALTETIAQSRRLGGDCPLCGATPLLVEARGLEGRRYLRCGRCAAEWPAPRLGCPACGQDDSGQLRVLAFEGEADRYRLGCCLACGYRVKVVATFAPLSPPGLLVAELATIHLDAIPDPDPAAIQGTG